MTTTPISSTASKLHSPRSSRGRPLDRLFRDLRRSGWIILSLGAILLAWWYVAPPRLGGHTTLVTVDGTSMLPTLSSSQLVALRPSSSYRVGDVVAYRSRLLHRLVLHRIVAVEDGRYTFKGDNNAFLDPEQPTGRQLVGKPWVDLPTAGNLVRMLRIPVVVAALTVFLVLSLGGLGPRGTPPGKRGAE